MFYIFGESKKRYHIPYRHVNTFNNLLTARKDVVCQIAAFDLVT